ncbi:pheromone A receptor-domain-containing protein [Mycena leptocephala]|nr:pheromone A receptor-domain-containing protein [Mycena leptocephala]
MEVETEANDIASRTHSFFKRPVAGLWKHELCRQRYPIASVRTVIKTHAEKPRAILIDLSIGLDIPLMQIPLCASPFSCSQFNLKLDIGCLGETYETAPAVVLFHLPPILIGTVSTVYCGTSSSSLPLPLPSPSSNACTLPLLLSASAHASLNLNRYLRLMALASTDLLLTVPLGIWVLYTNTHILGLSPWVSWADAHSNLSRVRSKYRDAAVGDGGVCTFLLCVLWVADESIKNYRGAFQLVARRVGYTSAGSSGSCNIKSPLSSSRGATIPVFIRKDTTQKRGSFDSFSSMSASYGGISSLEYDAEKAGTSETATHTR